MSSILSLLNAHPVSRNDNLLKISTTLGVNLELTQKFTKVQIQQAIEHFLLSHPQLEGKVREMANEITAEAKEKRKICESASSIETDSNTALNTNMSSQDYAIDTQKDLFAPTQITDKENSQEDHENELKRKHSDSVVEEDCEDDFEKNNKRQKTIVDELIRTIKDERCEIEKERSEWRSDIKQM